MHKVNTTSRPHAAITHVSPNNRLQHVQIWDTLGRGRGLKTYQYAWTVIDLADPLRKKESDKVASAFQAFYKRGPLKWQKILTSGPWTRVYGCCEQRGVSFRRGIPDLHRDQAIVERFDRTLPKRLSGFHIAREMRLPSGQRSTEWVVRLPSAVSL